MYLGSVAWCSVKVYFVVKVSRLGKDIVNSVRILARAHIQYADISIGSRILMYTTIYAVLWDGLEKQRR